MLRRRVWVDDWQMQCCGEPFHIGSDVSWATALVRDREWFESFLDEGTAASITDYEEHHGGEAEPVPLAGVVRSIFAVYCRYTSVGRADFPVAGSGELRPRSSADGWEDVGEDDQRAEPRFVGYLVDVDTAGVKSDGPPPADRSRTTPRKRRRSLLNRR